MLTNMRGMFGHTRAFNQLLGNWDVFNVTIFDNFNNNSSLEDKNLPKFRQNQ